MADSRSRGEIAPGTVVPSAPADAAPSVEDPGSLLWLNNALQILSTAAWYVAAPFIPLSLASQGTPVGVIGGIIGFSGVVPLLIAFHAGAQVTIPVDAWEIDEESPPGVDQRALERLKRRGEETIERMTKHISAFAEEFQKIDLSKARATT